MAQKRSTSKSSRRKSKRTVVWARAVWIVWSLVTGGSVAGWIAPDMPIVGPLMQSILSNKQVTEVLEKAPDTTWTKNLKKLQSDFTRPTTPTPTSAPTTPSSSAQKPGDVIRIATYNIQVFGVSKMAKTSTIDILAKIVRHFDIVAIQEVRAQDDAILPNFVAAINADGSRYNFVIGPRLGRTVSTEQYAYIYDTDRIEIDHSSVGTMSDPTDLLHREPLVARFRTRANSTAIPFSFWLVNVHTDPDEARSEVDVLARAFQVMQTARPDEDDVILLGDLNASEHQLGQLAQVPGIVWVVSGTTTNTRRDKMYDNILFSRSATTEYTGRWGVVDVQSVFGLTQEQALEVSDHFPAWAEFRIWESSPANNTALLPGFYRQ
ncbi:MAG: endonuclease/exonuclease/phosphatase family protein [Pirellulaceae bacterium]